MKPLEPLEHTAEDQLAWAEVVFRAAQQSPRLAGHLFGRSLRSDRRDAELMLGAHTAPLCVCCQEQMSVMYCDGRPIDIRGTVGHLP